MPAVHYDAPAVVVAERAHEVLAAAAEHLAPFALADAEMVVAGGDDGLAIERLGKGAVAHGPHPRARDAVVDLADLGEHRAVSGARVAGAEAGEEHALAACRVANEVHAGLRRREEVRVPAAAREDDVSLVELFVVLEVVLRKPLYVPASLGKGVREAVGDIAPHVRPHAYGLCVNCLREGEKPRDEY